MKHMVIGYHIFGGLKMSDMDEIQRYIDIIEKLNIKIQESQAREQELLAENEKLKIQLQLAMPMVTKLKIDAIEEMCNTLLKPYYDAIKQENEWLLDGEDVAEYITKLREIEDA